jgi:NAD(P)-dependent dehydrogenase (short-subunit alcohol dehydrogenase family)
MTINRQANLKGKKALVTGGSKGIGKEVVLELIKAGASVAIASRHPIINLTEAELEAREGLIKAYSIDFSEVNKISGKVSEIINDLEGLDILINSAGMAYTNEIINTSLADWQKVINLNLTSVFETIRAVIPAMRSQKSGTIINIASIAAKQAFPTWGAYSASKFGLMGLTQALAAEERSHGIKVMAICPGSVDTPLWDTLAPEVVANFDRRSMLEARTVAEMIMTMLSLPANATIQDLVLMPNFGIL